MRGGCLVALCAPRNDGAIAFNKYPSSKLVQPINIFSRWALLPPEPVAANHLISSQTQLRRLYDHNQRTVIGVHKVNDEATPSTIAFGRLPVIASWRSRRSKSRWPTLHVKAPYNTSTGCNASLFVPSLICERQLVPCATTSVLSGNCSTCLNNTNSPICCESS